MPATIPDVRGVTPSRSSSRVKSKSATAMDMVTVRFTPTVLSEIMPLVPFTECAEAAPPEVLYAGPRSGVPQPMATLRVNVSEAVRALKGVQLRVLYRIDDGMQHGLMPQSSPIPTIAWSAPATAKPVGAVISCAKMSVASEVWSSMVAETGGAYCGIQPRLIEEPEAGCP